MFRARGRLRRPNLRVQRIDRDTAGPRSKWVRISESCSCVKRYSRESRVYIRTTTTRSTTRSGLCFMSAPNYDLALLGVDGYLSRGFHCADHRPATDSSSHWWVVNWNCISRRVCVSHLWARSIINNPTSSERRKWCDVIPGKDNDSKCNMGAINDDEWMWWILVMTIIYASIQSLARIIDWNKS